MASQRLQSAFPKVHFSEGSLFRRCIVPKKRFIVPKVYWSEGSFIRNRGSFLWRFIVPKVHCAEIEVHCSEGSFIRNRGSLFRRFIIPKVQYSEISHLSDRKMLICYAKNEMIRALAGPLLCTYRLNWARRCFTRWIRWHCYPDTGFAPWHAWGRARYLSVTEVPLNI